MFISIVELAVLLEEAWQQALNKGISSMRVLLIHVKPGYRAVLTILMVVKRDEREILEKDRDFRFPFIQLVSGLLVREKFTEIKWYVSVVMIDDHASSSYSSVYGASRSCQQKTATLPPSSVEIIVTSRARSYGHQHSWKGTIDSCWWRGRQHT